MKIFLMKIPIILWIIISAIIYILLIAPLLPRPFDSYSPSGFVVLSTAAIHIPNKLTDSNGQYKPIQFLSLWVLGIALLVILFILYRQGPIQEMIYHCLTILIVGICYRVIEYYAIYRYHYLQSNK